MTARHFSYRPSGVGFRETLMETRCGEDAFEFLLASESEPSLHIAILFRTDAALIQLALDDVTHRPARP